MSSQENYVPLPFRSHTILGVCEALGEDFRFNPIILRALLAAMVLWSPLIAIGSYFALGAVVLVSRLLVPNVKHVAVEQPANAGNADSEDLPLAA